MSITRVSMVDSDGTPGVGTVVDAAFIGSVYDSIDTSWAWDTWVPVWGNAGTANTLGNGTISGRKFVIGKLVFWSISLTLGSTTASGNGAWTFTLPYTGSGIVVAAGVDGVAVDASSGSQYKVTAVNMTTTAFVGMSLASPMVALSATVPFTWATGDACVLAGRMERQ